MQVFCSSDWEATSSCWCKLGNRHCQGCDTKQLFLCQGWHKFNFGNSILDHLARGCWGTKQGGGVNHTSVWLGLCALAMLWTSSKQWQFVYMSGHWTPTCRCSDMPAIQRFTTTIFQAEQFPAMAHPPAPLLQHLLHSSWSFNYMARQLLKNLTPSMV